MFKIFALRVSLHFIVPFKVNEKPISLIMMPKYGTNETLFIRNRSISIFKLTYILFICFVCRAPTDECFILDKKKMCMNERETKNTQNNFIEN